MKKILVNRRRLRLDPWKSNNIFGLVLVDIDGDDPVNENPIQNLEKDEDIKVLVNRFF